MRTGNNVRLRKDGRFEARYIKSRDPQGHIIYGYCYGRSKEEATKKRDDILGQKKPAMRELSLLILGAGSHGEEVFELAKELRIFRNICFLDDDLSKSNTLGPCCNFSKYAGDFSVAIPAVGDTALRQHWMEELTDAGFLIPTLIHPTAIVSQSAQVGGGTVICARATVGPGVHIGQGCIISSGVTIDKNVDLPHWSYVDCGQTVTTHNIQHLNAL